MHQGSGGPPPNSQQNAQSQAQYRQQITASQQAALAQLARQQQQQQQNGGQMQARPPGASSGGQQRPIQGGQGQAAALQGPNVQFLYQLARDPAQMEAFIANLQSQGQLNEQQLNSVSTNGWSSSSMAVV